MTETRRSRRARQHTHEVRQPGTRFIITGAVLAIVTFTMMLLAIVGYLADRRAAAEERNERIDSEVSDVRNAVCDALAVTIMGATDPAVLARADAAGDELECDPPPSEREVDGYPVPTPVEPGQPQGAGTPQEPAAPPATAGAGPAPSTTQAGGQAPAAPVPGTVDPAPAPSAPAAPAPPADEPEPEPALLDPLLEPVCDLLGVCLGD